MPIPSPREQVQLQPPPRLGQSEGPGGLLMNAIPMLGSLGSIVLVTTMDGASTGGRHFLAAGMVLFTTVGFVVAQVDRQRRQRSRQVTCTRTDYLRHLSDVRRLARQAAAEQRRTLLWQHPQPATLPAIAQERTRVWEHGIDHPRFLHVRYGVCHQPLSLELVEPAGSPVDQVDPVAASALQRLLLVHRLQPDLPATLDLRGLDKVEVCGPREPARSLARSMICSAAAFHSPEHLVVAVLTTAQDLARWDWVKWLPHSWSGDRSDAVGPRRMVSTSPDQLASLLPADLVDRPRFGVGERPASPHLLLVLDGAELPPGNPVLPQEGVHGVTVLDLSRRLDDLHDAARVRLQLAGEADGAAPPAGGGHAAQVHHSRDEAVRAEVDQCSIATAEAFARRLTPLHRQGGVVHPSRTKSVGEIDYMALLALGRVDRYDPARAWQVRPTRDRLRVPIGTGEDGAPVHLDLKEAAQQGMGPHGLVIGATGSGKSELLRTLVLGLTMTHPPESLNLVLVDFKGGATFAGMSDLPHVSAVITNLAQELSLVDRMQDALSGEMVRRQEALRRAGLASAREHERARAAGKQLRPLPSLLVVVDEFSELLAAKPELIDLFVAIGRLGRSLGLHLLLASQRLEEGRLRGLESHLSYRVGLRTFSASESRAVLGVPDAYELPPVPGLAYLKPDPTTLVRFKAAYVSGPPSGRAPPTAGAEGNRPPGILPFTISEVLTLEVPTDLPEREPVPVVPRDQQSLLDVAVARMARHEPGAHQVWLPPLDVPDTLDHLMPDLAPDAQLGLISRQWRERGALVVPVGTLDRPREQRRETLSLDLSGAAGHVAVVGGPRSGKSTLLRALVTALALTTTPLEAQLYVLDFGGASFTGLTGLPHVAGVGSRSEPEVVSRIVAEVSAIADRRERYFRACGIDSIETYRSRRTQGQANDGYGDVFLVVDGWSTLRTEFEELETAVQQFCTRGLTFGLHVVAATARWADFRPATRDAMGSRLELRLGDPLDSEVDRTLAALVPQGRPGRGLVAGGLHFLSALPRIDGRAVAETLGEGIDDVVRRSATAWPGPAGPKLRLLPTRISLDEVRDRAREGGEAADTENDGRPLLLGLDERELAPVQLDPKTQPHLLVLGEGGSGKTAILRCLTREITRTRTPAQAQVVVVDYRRALLGEVPEPFLLGYLTSAQQADPALRDLATHLATRIPGPDVTPERLRSRSWWNGAEVFVLVDDYDLVAAPQSSPLAPLQPLLAQACDVGLHLIVARRSGGASRAMYEPVIQSMRDLAMPGLLLSCSPDEGPLLANLRGVSAPPGRGRLVTREHGVEVVQTAWTDPTL